MCKDVHAHAYKSQTLAISRTRVARHSRVLELDTYVRMRTILRAYTHACLENHSSYCVYTSCIILYALYIRIYVDINGSVQQKT